MITTLERSRFGCGTKCFLPTQRGELFTSDDYIEESSSTFYLVASDSLNVHIHLSSEWHQMPSSTPRFQVPPTCGRLQITSCAHQALRPEGLSLTQLSVKYNCVEPLQ